MEGIWKTLAAPLIVAIVSGIIVGIIIGRINTPETPSITAVSQWIDVPNPVYSLSQNSIDDAEKIANSLFGKTDIRRLIQATRFDPILRVVKLELTNNSELRSKEIEVSGNKESGFASSQTPALPFASKIKLRTLDPNASATVIGVIGLVDTFFSPRLLVLQDGKKVDVSSKNLPDSFEEYPLYMIIVGMFLAGSALFILIAIPVAIASSISSKFRAKLTTKEELAKTLTFIEYLREHNPEKFES